MESQAFRDSGFLFPSQHSSPNKRMRMTLAKHSESADMKELKQYLPVLKSDDYYTEPSLDELARRESLDPGYCSRVEDFTIGRPGYGCVKFYGKTDIRWLNLDQIVKLRRHEIAVYENETSVYEIETSKPAVGEGLNKPAEVTLLLRIGLVDITQTKLDRIVQRLRLSADRQGAEFISYNPISCEWKFMVQHFSRFGLNEEEDDIVMDDAGADAMEDSHELDGTSSGDGSPEGFDADFTGSELAHSLPAHLGLDPVKMKEMKMIMFPLNGSEDDNKNGYLSHEKVSSHGREMNTPIQHSGSRLSYRQSAASMRKTPLALLEYSKSTFDPGASGTVLMAQENKGLPMRVTKAEGFELDSKLETPVARNHSCNIVDAALFMGRSFRVGWGPNGVLVHSGTPINDNAHIGILSSVLSIEKVAVDKVARDETNKVKQDTAESFFDSVLELHRSLNHEAAEVNVGSFSLRLQKVIFDRVTLPSICGHYRELVETQLELPGLPASVRLSLNHHVVLWELIKVLFSEREKSEQPANVEVDEEEDMMQDSKASPQIDHDALPLVRRAEFSYWLQESVYHRVQEDLSCLDDSNYLEQIFLLLSGKQLDAAAELAVSKGDVRLACLLSQADGSMLNRSDIARQLSLWRINGMDFNFVEKERIKLYELLAGNIHGALDGRKIDWKRFLGLLMWYELPAGTHLPEIFRTYHRRATERTAPYPAPIYIDEGPLDETSNGSDGGHCDIAYHLMLLHAGEANELNDLKSMLSAFASTNDPLDYHMIWHQRAILEAVDVFSSDDLHLLDIGYVSQLLCLGHCHWAIYVVLHMTYREDFPHLHFKLIKEILFQYCETWSTNEKQRQFIEDLGVPSVWMHEAMAVYHSYNGDLPKALEHFIESGNWQKAHSVFVTSVAHSMYLAGEHSEVWRLAASLDEHKSEIEDWDLGAGIYVAFYIFRSSLKDEDDGITKLVPLENKADSCKEFFDILNKSLEVLGNKLTINARVAYSKMAEEISTLLLAKSEDSSGETQLQCFNTLASAPVPEDLRSCHLQDGVSLFTSFLAEEVS